MAQCQQLLENIFPVEVLSRLQSRIPGMDHKTVSGPQLNAFKFHFPDPSKH